MLALQKRNNRILKLLWTFGLFGEPKEEGASHLVIDSKTYLMQKIHSNYSAVKKLFEYLEEYGVHCEHISLKEEGWLTPTGALRKGGWYIRMSFDDKAGGAAALRALKIFATKLKEKYGKKAYRYFSRADLRILRED